MTETPRSPSPHSPRDLQAAGIIGLMMLVTFAWWWQMHATSTADFAARLRSAFDRGAELKRQIAALKPPEPDCPPGTSVKTYSPDAVLPPAATASGLLPPSASAPSAGGASAPPGLAATSGSPALQSSAPTGAFAGILPDFALAQKLEQATAMVAVSDGKSMISGSGFFISPNLFVTNRHVVDRATADNMVLISRSLGQARRVTVLSKTQVAQTGSADFALLKLTEGTAPGILPISAQVGKLSSVVAAGYPDVVMENDDGFQRLLRHDTSTPPELNMTQGAVQTMLPGDAGMQLVVHTASINHGNSGGPLIDACGRVVGINTFMSLRASEASKTNYAIGGISIEAFLKAAGVDIPPDTRPCGARN